jgi:hypothetical protein
MPAEHSAPLARLNQHFKERLVEVGATPVPFGRQVFELFNNRFEYYKL